MPSVVSVKRIWGAVKHNALADLIHYQNHFFCCLRESNSHAAGDDGKIRILKSKDGDVWDAVTLLTLKDVDLRDPMLSQMPDGRLVLTMGASVYDNGKYKGRHPAVAFSNNGVDWTPVTLIDLPEEWVWRLTWHQGTGYGVSYRVDPKDRSIPWIATLFSTKDALHYTPVTQFDVSKNPSEATLRVDADGTMIALLRRQGEGWIGSAKSPFKEWDWVPAGYRVAGPNFLILPNGDMWAGSRFHRFLKNKIHCYTTLAKMTPNSYQPVLILPSAGDTSYPGMVYLGNLLYMCYYSSHEGKAMVYLAVIDLEQDTRGC